MSKHSRNQVRLIGGKLRRHHLTFPDVPHLRPTLDRVRETLFNWLGQDLTGKTCLDLFAGSGALGFEAASRYAKEVIMIENHPAAFAALKENCTRLKLENIVTLHHRSALDYLAQSTALFDIIFLDPPFKSELLTQVLPLLSAHLTENGVVYIEAVRLPVWEGANWIKKGRAGEVEYGLMGLKDKLHPPVVPA